MLRPAFAALSAIVLVSGCSGPASVQQAREGVDTFHANFNNGTYQAIWDSSSFDLKNTTTPPQFFQLLDGVKGYYGKVVATEQQSWGFNTNNGDSFSRVNMRTTFEKGAAYEQFTYRNIGEGKQQLAGWSISKNPPPSDSASSSAAASPSGKP